MALAEQPKSGQPMRPLPTRVDEPLPPGVAHPMMPPPRGNQVPLGSRNPNRPDGTAPGSVFTAPPSIIENTPAIMIPAKPQINLALKTASTKGVLTTVHFLCTLSVGLAHELKSPQHSDLTAGHDIPTSYLSTISYVIFFCVLAVLIVLQIFCCVKCRKKSFLMKI